jgi:hypothetical protein
MNKIHTAIFRKDSDPAPARQPLFEVCVKVRRRANDAEAARNQIAAIFGLTLNEVKYAEKICDPQEITDESIRGITSGVEEVAA